MTTIFAFFKHLEKRNTERVDGLHLIPDILLANVFGSLNGISELGTLKGMLCLKSKHF